MSVLVFMSVFPGSLLVYFYPNCHRAPFFSTEDSLNKLTIFQLILERKNYFFLWPDLGDWPKSVESPQSTMIAHTSLKCKAECDTLSCACRMDKWYCVHMVQRKWIWAEGLCKGPLIATRKLLCSADIRLTLLTPMFTWLKIASSLLGCQFPSLCNRKSTLWFNLLF